MCRHHRDINAAYINKLSDDIGALDCILHVVETVISEESTSEERS